MVAATWPNGPAERSPGLSEAMPWEKKRHHCKAPCKGARGWQEESRGPSRESQPTSEAPRFTFCGCEVGAQASIEDAACDVLLRPLRYRPRSLDRRCRRESCGGERTVACLPQSGARSWVNPRSQRQRCPPPERRLRPPGGSVEDTIQKRPRFPGELPG